MTGHDHSHADHPHRHDLHEPAGFKATESPVPIDDLSEGCGRGKILFLDAASGIAGDMTIAALVHLGVPFRAIESAVAALPLAGFELRLATGRVGAIAANRFEVQIDAGQTERHYAEIRQLIESSPLADAVRRLALRIFERLARAEAKVHQIPLERVHFHEVGAIDAIVDVVGAAAAVVYLGAEVVASPLPLGHGFVHCRHGVIPLPAPATVECLRDVPTYAADLEAETVTPTGAAIVATLCKRFTHWPAMAPERTGWGAGTRAFPDRPNVLRAVLGARTDTSRANDQSAHEVLEANIDDMTGELTGHVMSLLMQSGALDAWATPITMKKGRPGVVLSAIAAPGDAHRISELILRETTTLGVRRTLAERVERPRRIIEVTTRFGVVPVKAAAGPFGPVQFKPEFDACVRIAQQHDVPVREVIAEAFTRARAESESR
jgi:uncharacterized protein (TIGR00299 family) protein